jgi:hypothetical protein
MRIASSSMAGLAAILRTTSITSGTSKASKALHDLRQRGEALSRALAPRGAEDAERTHGRATVLIRSALPIIHEADGCAAVVDGVAEVGTLIGEYVKRGPSALVGGLSPYALIIADPARDGLVLARNGDGAPLYYARTDDAVLVASEPGALVAAGVPARPDTAVIERFLATGACDDTPATFYADIRRVMPGQIVMLTGEHTVAYESAPAAGPTRAALRLALGQGRIGVRLSAAPGCPVVLEAAARQTDLDDAQLQVYSAQFPGLPDPTPSLASALLAALPTGSFRHRSQPCFADELDLDGFLRDVGEPMPDLESYLTWSIASTTGGEIDALLDGATGGHHLSRLADRVASRYGVELRFPLRTPAGVVSRSEIVAEVLVRMSGEQLAPLVHARLKPQVATVAMLLAGRRVDAMALFRRLLVERWLRLIAPGSSASRPARVGVPTASANGRQWRREPIATEQIAAGDLVVERFAFHIAEAVRSVAQPWYLLVAGRPVAVAQGLARAAWQVRPGSLARLLGGVSRREPWRVQALIDEAGAMRGAGAVLLPATWSTRLVEPGSVGFPRPDSVGPAKVSIVPLPQHPVRVAAQLTGALEKVLPEAAWEAYRGCAVIGAGRVIGWSGPGDPEIAGVLAAGDPFGSGVAMTPIVIATEVPLAAKIASPRRGKPARSGKSPR